MSGAARAAVFGLALAACDPRVTTIGELDAGLGTYLEAESGVLSGGFVIQSDSAASGGRYITAAVGMTSEDAPGPARAVYELDARVNGTYLIWGRVHDPDIDRNRYFFQVDDADFIKWRISTGDEWFWDALHQDMDYGTQVQFELSAGKHRLTIANSVDGASLDRLYFAPNRGKPEGDTPVCNPPHSVELDGGCNPSCGSLGGQCGGTPCVGLVTISTYDCPACCTPDE
ncbi:MAG TPA: hypothetical protein VGM44_23200 [Polyangiaceae bacterium]